MREGSDKRVEDENVWFWNEVSEERGNIVEKAMRLRCCD